MEEYVIEESEDCFVGNLVHNRMCKKGSHPLYVTSLLVYGTYLLISFLNAMWGSSRANIYSGSLGIKQPHGLTIASLTQHLHGTSRKTRRCLSSSNKLNSFKNGHSKKL